MIYHEYPPDTRLSHLIETYWVTDAVLEEPFSYKVFPDGCVDIIFDFSGHIQQGGLQTGLPELVGTMTSLLDVSLPAGRVEMMGIRFSPGGICAFTQMPVFEFTNQNINLPLSETLFSNGFYERLPDMECMTERINYINRYLLSRLHTLYTPDKRIHHAVSIIRKNNGCLSVKQIANEVCMCERHFERKFKTTIGITPKMFSNVMRFGFAHQYIKTHADESLFMASISCGYHDLAHMNKEFQRFGGTSPSELMNNVGFLQRAT